MKNGIFVKDGKLCRMVDVTSRVYFPSPQFSMISVPSYIDLRLGAQEPVELQLKSNTNIKSQAFLSVNGSSDMQSSVTPNRVFLPPNGISSSLLNVKASESAKAHPYTLPIVANFSIPTEAINSAYRYNG
jgi:hypothetical protein